MYYYFKTVSFEINPKYLKSAQVDNSLKVLKNKFDLKKELVTQNDGPLFESH